jgi:hypothetical protein
MKQRRALTYEEREKLLARLNSLRGSFIGLFAKLVNDLSYRREKVPLELLIYDLGGIFTKLHYVILYAMENGMSEEAEKLIAGLDALIDFFLIDEYDLQDLHEKMCDIVKDVFGAYPGLCFVFGDYKNCKEV